MIDCIIIGSGVAGISSALTLQANKRTFLLFGNNGLSEKISKAELIKNYPGLSNVTGKEFINALKKQLLEADIRIKEEKVSNVFALDGKFGVATQEGGYYEGKTVILASGVDAVKKIDGEEEFLGRGVSYCATCDGFLYKGKTIAVVCTSKRLEHELEHLTSFAEKIYFTPLYKEVGRFQEKVEVVRKPLLKIKGEKRVNEIVFADKSIAVDGVFILRESSLPDTLIAGLEVLDGHVVTARDMQTNIDGFYAVGDCTGRPYQYAKAVGEGNVAGHAVTARLIKKG